MKFGLRTLSDYIAEHIDIGRSKALLPNLIIIGATRSGTTFLHSALNSHPDIFMARKKELEFFNSDQNYDETLHGYHKMFHGYRGERWLGESTPLYFHKGGVFDKSRKFVDGVEDDAIVRIAKHLPSAKLIVSLRNPLERMISEYEKNFVQGKENSSLDDMVRKELDGQDVRFRYVYSGQYEVHLEHVFQFFPQENVNIQIFEDIKERPDYVVQGLMDFLALPNVGLNLSAEARNERGKYDKNKIVMGKDQSKLGDDTMHRVSEIFTSTKSYVEGLVGRSVPW